MSEFYKIYWKDPERLTARCAKNEEAKRAVQHLFGDKIFMILDADAPAPKRNKKDKGTPLVIESLVNNNKKLKDEVEELRRQLVEKNEAQVDTINITESFEGSNEEIVIQMYKAGKDVKTISKELGIHHSTVKKYLKGYQAK